MAELNVEEIWDALVNSSNNVQIEESGFFAIKPFASLGLTITNGQIISVLVILVVTFILAKVLSNIVRRMLVGSLDKSNLSFIEKLTRWIIYFFGFLAVSGPLGIDFSGLMVAGGIIAVAIGFASQSTLSNFISGVLLMFERPVKLGDNISVKGTQGYVEDIGLMSTTLRTYQGIYVRVPNEAMFTSDITNYVAHIARRFEYDITIRYKDDADKAMKIIIDTISKHPYALKSPSPFVYVHSLGPNGTNLNARVWSPSGYWWDARTELLQKIMQALRAEGIVMPFEQNVMWFGNNPPEKGFGSASQAKKLETAMYGSAPAPAPEDEYLHGNLPDEGTAPENAKQGKQK